MASKVHFSKATLPSLVDKVEVQTLGPVQALGGFLLGYNQRPGVIDSFLVSLSPFPQKWLKSGICCFYSWVILTTALEPRLILFIVLRVAHVFAAPFRGEHTLTHTPRSTEPIA